MYDAPYPQVWFTYGPQTKEDSTLRDLIAAGATGARLTFSYGTPELQIERANQIRTISRNLGKDLFLVADLQGEKCRFARLDEIKDIPVTKGERLLLTDQVSNLNSVPRCIKVQTASYFKIMSPGDVIIEGDGALLLSVVEVMPNGIICAPESDGVIHPGRGIVVRSKSFHPESLTAKDLADFSAIRSSKMFDAIAISFVADTEPIERLRSGMREACLPLIAKIETAEGLGNITSIVNAADAIMAGRGDLALAMPWEELPAAVHTIATTSHIANKPWILATQLVEGLERFSFPTRAEICDLAHWIDEGAHGVMLSYETAFGPRPVDSVSCVQKIVERYKKTVACQKHQ
ncbi:MAG TPA: pyruvate kinase [Candidatus Angelobacter sp.]|nr:pyruvate kinase [Candidatus Angelobacter sp.]